MCSGNTGKLEVGHHQEVEFCVVVTAQVKGPESQLSRLSSLVWAGARVSVWAQAEGKISWRSTPKERSPVLSICSVICPSGSQQRYVALCSPTTILSSLSLTQLLSLSSVAAKHFESEDVRLKIEKVSSSKWFFKEIRQNKQDSNIQKWFDEKN